MVIRIKKKKHKSEKNVKETLMKAKRILSALLTLLMLTTVLTCLPLSGAAEATVQITATNPLLTANVGDTVSLSGVKVDGLSGTITWTQGGKPVTSCTPDQKGVTVLTASDGTNSRNVYLVAKETSETEYVLYENDFSGTLADLTAEGWKFPDGRASVSDGQLHLGLKSDYTSRAFLPAWLGDFGDYQITAEASQTNVQDTGRWSSIIYRCAENTNYRPFYHMCVRANTSSNTLEFAEMLENGNWNVIAPNGITNLNMTNSFHQLTVKAYENVVEYIVDGKSEFYTSSATAHSKGLVGLFSNQGTMNLKSIRVTVLENKPAEPIVVPKLIDTAANRPASNINNYVSNHAYAATPEAFNELLGASSQLVAVLLDLTGKTVAKADFENYIKVCTAKNVIPEFKLSSKEQVNALIEALDATRTPEALVASEDLEIVKYARTQKKTLIRGAWDVTNLTAEKLSDSELFDLYTKAAGAHAQAIILPYALATKSNVALLQEYELAVWAFGKEIDTDTEAAWLLTSGANAVVSDNWNKIASAQTTIFTAQNSLTRTPVWTAHRGYSSAYPENSLSAFNAAYEAGADFVECDVHLSSDNVVMVCHDDTINRTTNGMGAISAMTSEAIRKFKLRKPNGSLSDEIMPTFEELLELVKGKDMKILCEFKSYNVKLAQETAALIKKHGMEEQVVFISFAANQLEQIKKHLNTSTGLLLSAPAYADEKDSVKTLNNYYTQQSTCLSYHSTIAINFGNITAEFLRDAQDRGMTLFSWTYSTYHRAKVCEMFLAGMNGMTTNDPQELQNATKTLRAPQTLYVSPNGSSKLSIRSETYKGVVTDVTANAKIKVLDNDGVIEVAADGTVTAKKEGSATLLASYESKLPNGASYTLYTQPITVMVKELDKLTILDDSNLSIDENNRLVGMTENTTLAALLAQIADSESVTVTDVNGKAVTDANALIGTGCVLTYKNSKATVLLLGDLDGNGKVEARDCLRTRRYFFGLTNLNDLQKLAADVNGVGGVTAQDCLKIRRHFFGLTNLYA